MNGQLADPVEFRNNGCFIKNAFTTFDDYSEKFQYSEHPLYHWVNYDDSSIDSPNDFIQYLNLNEDYRFEIRSNFTYNERETVRYKEFFQNREILPGGVVFGPGPGQPCRRRISAFIYSGMDDIEAPNIIHEDIEDIVDGDIVKADLVLDINPNDGCNFIQLWQIQYVEGGECKWAWIDASTGDLIRDASCGDNLYSMNLDNLSKDIENSSRISSSNFSNQNSFLDPNENLDIILVSRVDCGESVDANSVESVTADDNTEIVCPDIDSEGEVAFENENHQELFDAFNATNSCFQELEINFPPAYVLVDCAIQSPSSFPFSENQQSGILFQFPSEEQDFNNFDKWYSTDIISHEYGHHFLNNFFLSITSDSHDIIHEYFSDLFAIYVSSVGCEEEIDWELNNDDGVVIRDFDLENPCKYLNLENPLSGFSHSHIEPFNYMAYTLVDGGFIGLEDFFNMTVDILSIFPDDGDLSDLAEFYLQSFQVEFGECSDESDFLVELLEDLCLYDDARLVDCEINFDITSSGSSGSNINSVTTYEHVANGLVIIRLTSDDLNDDAKYFWSGLRPDWIINNTTNNQNTNATQIRIQFPKFLTYPRRFTICAYAPSLEDHRGCIDIEVEDCNNDDPDCDVSIELEDDLREHNTEARSINEILESNNLVRIYNINGMLISEGFVNFELEKLNQYPQQIFIIEEYNTNGSLISITKYYNGAKY